MLIVVVITIFVVRFILFIIFFCCCLGVIVVVFFYSCRRHTETRILTHPIICDVGDIDPLTKNTLQILAKMSDWRSLIFVISTEFLSLFHDAHFMRKSVLSISQSVLSSKWFFSRKKRYVSNATPTCCTRLQVPNYCSRKFLVSQCDTITYIENQSVFLEIPPKNVGHLFHAINIKII